MAEQCIKTRVFEAMKLAMRAKQKERLVVIRLILAAFKQREIDERIEIDDPLALEIFDKMLKQRRDSIKQYKTANRTDLAEQEAFEIDIIQEFMPAQLSQADITALISDAIATTKAQSIRDMGQVMGIVKPKVQGRAEMAEVSKLVKAQLS